ncbi:MAG TPA: hypothetical protein VIL37_08680 [Natronosporangium sp.]
MADTPREQQYYRGVAAVPQPQRRASNDTADLPVEPLTPTLYDDKSPGRDRLAVAPRGMVVRRRWRQLRSGAGWTWTGLCILLTCWGIWVLSVRGTELVGPVIGLVLVLLTGLLLFVLARWLGRAVLERALGRERDSAWPSHLTVCLFFTAAGITFLQQTIWIRDSMSWLGDGWDQLTSLLQL